MQRILVKPLEAASVFLAAGPRIFDVTAAGVVRIPRLVSMTVGHIVDKPSGLQEGGSVTGARIGDSVDKTTSTGAKTTGSGGRSPAVSRSR